MVVRTARRGPNLGNKFLGCSGFPSCRKTLPLDYAETNSKTHNKNRNKIPTIGSPDRSLALSTAVNKNLKLLKVGNSQLANDGISHIREFVSLERQVGPILDDIKNLYFNFHSTDLDRFYESYRLIYGEKAFEYALQAASRWKNGSTKMSGQTANRLLNLVPNFLSTTQRYDLVEKLCLHHVKKSDHTIYINRKDLDSAYRDLDRAIQKISNPVTLKYLPNDVQDTIRWLVDADIVASRNILAKVDDVINSQVKSEVEKSRNLIRGLIRSEKKIKYSERFNFATGSIVIFMPDEKWCFIANAVFEESESEELRILREFRDRVLLQSCLGKYLVSFYYSKGRYIASKISKSLFLKATTKIMLKTFVYVLTKSMKYERKQ